MITYTTIIHQAREELGLSLNEYALADIIYQLQNSPTSKYEGWCYSSKAYLGKCIGVSEQAVHGILNKLYEKELLENEGKVTHNSLIRVTQRWYECVINIKNQIKPNTKESLVSTKILKKVEYDTQETLVSDAKETLVNNNKRYNNNINIYNNISYLTNLPLEDVKEFTSSFNITERQLKEKAEVLFDYCKYKGKVYKDYKAFLRNAIRKEFGKKRVAEVFTYKEIPEMDRDKNIEKMKELKEKIGNVFNKI